MSTHRRDFEKTKHMSFLIKNDELLEKLKKIWEEFDGESKRNGKSLKTKIRFYK